MNWMFREPFTIDEREYREPLSSVKEDDSVGEILDSTTVGVSGNTLITLGTCKPDEARDARRLADKLKCPILSDITSGMRTGSLELPTEFSLPQPNTILHIGGRVVSKSWLSWSNTLEESGTKFVHLTPTGQTFNPNRLPQKKIQMHLSELVAKVEGPCASSHF